MFIIVVLVVEVDWRWRRSMKTIESCRTTSLSLNHWRCEKFCSRIRLVDGGDELLSLFVSRHCILRSTSMIADGFMKERLSSVDSPVKAEALFGMAWILSWIETLSNGVCAYFELLSYDDDANAFLNRNERRYRFVANQNFYLSMCCPVVCCAESADGQSRISRTTADEEQSAARLAATIPKSH